MRAVKLNQINVPLLRLHLDGMNVRTLGCEMRESTLSSLMTSWGSLDSFGRIVADFMATHLVLSSSRTRIFVHEMVEKRLCSIVSISVCQSEGRVSVRKALGGLGLYSLVRYPRALLLSYSSSALVKR